MNEDTQSEDSKVISHNGFKRINIYFAESEYERIISDNKNFKERLNYNIEHYPDFFPEVIKNGYCLCGLSCNFRPYASATQKNKMFAVLLKN